MVHDHCQVHGRFPGQGVEHRPVHGGERPQERAKERVAGHPGASVEAERGPPPPYQAAHRDAAVRARRDLGRGRPRPPEAVAGGGGALGRAHRLVDCRPTPVPLAQAVRLALERRDGERRRGVRREAGTRAARAPPTAPGPAREPGAPRRAPPPAPPGIDAEQPGHVPVGPGLDQAHPPAERGGGDRQRHPPRARCRAECNARRARRISSARATLSRSGRRAALRRAGPPRSPPRPAREAARAARVRAPAARSEAARGYRSARRTDLPPNRPPWGGDCRRMGFTRSDHRSGPRSFHADSESESNSTCETAA